MNTRSECRDAALRGDLMIVDMLGGRVKILFRFVAGVVYVVDMSTQEHQEAEPLDHHIDSLLGFVDALDLPRRHGDHRERITFFDRFGDWHTISFDPHTQATVIDWTEREAKMVAQAALDSMMRDRHFHADDAVHVVAP